MAATEAGAMPSSNAEPMPSDAAAAAEAHALVQAAAPRTGVEWLAVHNEVHRIADRAPHPWLVLASVAEALMACRPPEP